MTAAVASFGHGANDVSNAVGPLSAIWGIWQTNQVSSRSEVPIWILAYGGKCNQLPTGDSTIA